ncbi:MAG: D-aminoacyl-tRNA deacylase [Caldilineaceae bacterium]
MRAVVQRVSRARVTVDGREVGAIGRGLLVLMGVAPADGAREVQRLARKIATLRIFEDDDGKMNLSVAESGGAVLAVSQFTLYADVRKGRRPSFTDAALPAVAEPRYAEFCAALEAEGLAVARGLFGAHMQVELVNDGPVTIWLDTAELPG